jgi:hypothetical protein
MEIIVVTAVWTIFACGLFFYVIAVRRSEPITVDEAKILWKIHKRTTRCNGKKWQPIAHKGGKLKGFQCDCGYRYTQRRPIVAGTHKVVHQSYWDSFEVEL